MILKGSQRSGGTDLATHLMNGFDNELVEIAQIRNVVADDLHGAFAEYEAAATGTRCKKPLYSLSINPPTPITKQQYLVPLLTALKKCLNLSGQPRAIVFHKKQGREHCHVVWSRIDITNMRAIQISYDHFKLKALSRELAAKFGLDLPPGLDPNTPTDYIAPEQTLADNAQTSQTGISPEQRRFDITEAYMACDNGRAFHAALSEMGYHLAKGTRRSYVIIDQYGHVHSLSRYIEGVRGKQIKAKLSDIDHDTIPSIDEVKARSLEKWPEPEIDSCSHKKTANQAG